MKILSKQEKIKKMVEKGLPIISFKSANELREWLIKNHSVSEGAWLRIYKKNSGVKSVTFDEVLDEGLCFGCSESKRIKCDKKSYLQRFTPRRTIGTTSKRNLDRVKRLIKENKMTKSGLKARGLENLGKMGEKR